MESEQFKKELNEEQELHNSDEIFICHEDFHEMCKKFKKSFDAADKIRVPLWSIYEIISNPFGSTYKYHIERIAAYDSYEKALEKAKIFKGYIVIRKEQKAVNGNYYDHKNIQQPTVTYILQTSDENQMFARFYTSNKEHLWASLNYVKADNQISSNTVFFACKNAPDIDVSSIDINKDFEYYFE